MTDPKREEKYTIEEMQLITQLAAVHYSPEQVEYHLKTMRDRDEELLELRTQHAALNVKSNQTADVEQLKLISQQYIAKKKEIDEMQTKQDDYRKKHHLIVKVGSFAYRFRD